MNYFTDEFYCTQCGNRGIPIIRKSNKNRKAGHLKKLYCLNCKKETNHVECKPFGKYTYDEFKIEFTHHNFNKEGQRINPNWIAFVREVKQNGV